MTGQIHIDIEIGANVLEKLLDALSRGEMTSIILTRERKPAARLAPPSSGAAPDRQASFPSRFLTPMVGSSAADYNEVGGASDRRRAP